MKTIAVLLAGLGLFATLALADETATNAPIKVPSTEAKSHIGTNAVVTGTIVEVNKAPKLIRLNFDQPFPKSTFTAVIFAKNTNDFPEVEKLKGKSVEVTGLISAYQERPQIVLTKTNQLKVIEAPVEKK